MTTKQIADMIAETGLPYAYYQFDPDPNNPPPDPPFICFYYPYDNDVKADDINYARINHLIVELYTDNKDFTVEGTVEAVLLSYALPFSKTESYVDTEKMYQITYEMEVVING